MFVVVGVYLGMQWYIASWALRYFPGLPVSATAARLGALAVALSFPLSIYLLRVNENPVTEAMARASFVWAGVSLIAVSWAFFGDCALLAARAAGAGERVRPMVAWTVPGVVVVLSCVALWNASRMPRVKDVVVPVRGLPAALDGFTIAHLSDLHLGVTVSTRKWERIVALVNGLSPDLVVLNGDFIDAGLRERARVESACMALKARLGKVAVLGNHEVYGGIKEASGCMARCGARLLRNEVVELPGGLQVAGVDDVIAMGVSREEVAALLGRLDQAKPSIYVSHQPLYFDVAAEYGVSLMMSGHTHQGQIFPFGGFVRLMQKYVYGMYRLGGSLLYVSSGTGEWGPPMRLFTRSEVVRFVLRRASEPAVR